MKIACEKAILLGAVAAASRTVTTRSSIPALEGILIEASQTTVTFTGYNLATGIRASVAAEIKEPGAVVINARLLGDIVRKSPDDVVTISVDEKMSVDIDCGMSHFTLIGIPAEDFPDLPEVEQDRRMELSQELLGSMLTMTMFAISDNEAKLVHTGSLFEVKGGVLTVVSVDGYRMALRREAVDSAEDFSFVVPGPALREVAHLCGDDETPVAITLGRRHIVFDMGEATLVSRLLEGEFLNYQNAIPKDAAHKVVVETKPLESAVDRVSLMISERLKNPIRCVFQSGVLQLGCQTALGRANDELPMVGNGGDIEIGFNNRYLSDAVRAVPDDRVQIELTNAISPCILRPVDGDNYLFMVLPVRLKG